MGAASFEVVARGKTADDAFHRAVRDAQWERGHGGYTGTIAEKSEFVMAEGKPDSMTPTRYVHFLEHDGFDAAYGHATAASVTPAQRRDAKVYHEKWGPALCIPIEPGVWLFAGYASS